MEGRFCETFHSTDDGWRDCESCGKVCVISRYLASVFLLLLPKISTYITCLVLTQLAVGPLWMCCVVQSIFSTGFRWRCLHRVFQAKFYSGKKKFVINYVCFYILACIFLCNSYVPLCHSQFQGLISKLTFAYDDFYYLFKFGSLILVTTELIIYYFLKNQNLANAQLHQKWFLEF